MRIQAAVLTVSDTRSAENDPSGDLLEKLLTSAECDIIVRNHVSDELMPLREAIFSLAERDDIDLVVTTGGTGFSPRDNTPEATRAVIEREAPGIAEAMRRETAASSPLSMLSRGICGIRSNTLILNLPGSPKAVEECFAVVGPVLQHAVRSILGDKLH